MRQRQKRAYHCENGRIRSPHAEIEHSGAGNQHHVDVGKSLIRSAFGTRDHSPTVADDKARKRHDENTDEQCQARENVAITSHRPAATQMKRSVNEQTQRETDERRDGNQRKQPQIGSHCIKRTADVCRSITVEHNWQNREQSARKPHQNVLERNWNTTRANLISDAKPQAERNEKVPRCCRVPKERFNDTAEVTLPRARFEIGVNQARDEKVQTETTVTAPRALNEGKNKTNAPDAHEKYSCK